MKFRATWPVTDPACAEDELIAEAQADLPNLRPDGYSLYDLKWTVTTDAVTLEASVLKHRPPAKCGTDGGYYRHKRTTYTDPCEPCKEAHRAYERHRKAVKRGEQPKGPPRTNQPSRRPCVDCGKETRAKWGQCRSCAEKNAREAEDVPPTWIRRGLIWVAERRDEAAA